MITETVTRHVGNRTEINRQEMAAILADLHGQGLDLRGQPAGTLDTTRLINEGGLTTHPQHPQAHEWWARACRGITIISVVGRGADACVRHDQPGTMDPYRRAGLMFVPRALLTAARDPYDSDPMEYLARGAERVLVVKGEKLTEWVKMSCDAPPSGGTITRTPTETDELDGGGGCAGPIDGMGPQTGNIIDVGAHWSEGTPHRRSGWWVLLDYGEIL